jgi:uncharacterized protein (TIGR02611 family)
MKIDDTQQLGPTHTRELTRTTAIKQTRRIVILVIGSTLIVAGLALIPIPGPFSIPLILLGLTVLSWEFAWAKRLLYRIKSKIKDFRDARRNARA